MDHLTEKFLEIASDHSTFCARIVLRRSPFEKICARKMAKKLQHIGLKCGLYFFQLANLVKICFFLNIHQLFIFGLA